MKEQSQGGQRRAGHTQHTFNPSAKCQPGKVETVARQDILHTKGYNLRERKVFEGAEGFIDEKEMYHVTKALSWR